MVSDSASSRNARYSCKVFGCIIGAEDVHRPEVFTTALGPVGNLVHEAGSSDREAVAEDYKNGVLASNYSRCADSVPGQLTKNNIAKSSRPRHAGNARWRERQIAAPSSALRFD